VGGQSGEFKVFRLIRSLVRPYWVTLSIILVAMVVQTVMSVAGPWPLKIILDNVVGSRKLRRGSTTCSTQS
jgi:ABC-type multidrug transport system fused ATPase/permease subunit